MGAGFEVVSEDLQRSGAAMERAAAQARDLHVADHVATVRAAMPASAAAAAAADFLTAWEREVGQWVRASARHGEALRTDARDYEAVDATVDAELTGTTTAVR